MRHPAHPGQKVGGMGRPPTDPVITCESQAAWEAWLAEKHATSKPRSNWSRINRGKAEQLIREGRMQPAGLREIERARVDGRWDADHDV